MPFFSAFKYNDCTTVVISIPELTKSHIHRQYRQNQLFKILLNVTWVYPVYFYYYQINLSLLVHSCDLDTETIADCHMYGHRLPKCILYYTQSNLQLYKQQHQQLWRSGKTGHNSLANLLNLCNCTGHESESARFFCKNINSLFQQEDISSAAVSKIHPSILNLLFQRHSLTLEYKHLFFTHWDKDFKNSSFLFPVACNQISILPR